jgi:hypothetical protein
VLTSGVLKFDAEGRVILSASSPVAFNGGTPIAVDGGLASEPGATADVFIAGIGYTTDEKLTDSDSPLLPQEGPLTNRDGQLRISSDPPVVWYAGLPLTAEGFLSVAPIGPPVIGPGAFDQSFSNAFDNGSP